MDTKHIHHIHPPSPFPCDPSPHWYPPQEKIYFSLLHFIFLIQCILIVQGGFTLVLQVCVYCVFEINSAPSITHSLSTTMLP
jgi:hypothetical protein